MTELVAYLGPETMLPITSVLAGAVGLVLIFWHFIVACVKKAFALIFRRSP